MTTMRAPKKKHILGEDTRMVSGTRQYKALCGVWLWTEASASSPRRGTMCESCQAFVASSSKAPAELSSDAQIHQFRRLPLEKRLKAFQRLGKRLFKATDRSLQDQEVVVLLRDRDTLRTQNLRLFGIDLSAHGVNYVSCSPDWVDLVRAGYRYMVPRYGGTMGVSPVGGGRLIYQAQIAEDSDKGMLKQVIHHFDNVDNLTRKGRHGA